MAHQKQIIIFCSLGVFFTMLGITAICIIPGLISMLVHQKMALIPSNPSYPLWRDLDLPIYQQFYFYNVTNAEEVEKAGAKANLTEVGPFVFRLNMTKSLLTFRDSQSKLMFREKRTYYFDRKLSAFDLDISLTTLNVPLAVAYDTLDFDSMNFFVRLALEKFLSRQSFFFTASPRELIFEGKRNDISCMAHILDPAHNPDCYFSYFRGQNATDDGLYEIFTGVDNIRDINAIVTLNGSSRLDIWDGDQCNRIDGASNGELFPPMDVVNGSLKTLQFFRSDFCRVFNLTLSQPYIPADVGSMLVDRFRPDEKTFANATVNPDNSCFRPNPNKTSLVDSGSTTLQTLINFLQKEGFEPTIFKEILNEIGANQTHTSSKSISAKLKPFSERPSGVFDMSACHDGVPIMVSFPHFYEADPYYLEAFNGLSPNKSKHETYIDIEPVTGTPVDFLARIQVNIEVNTTRSKKPMKSVVFPTLWQEFSIHITDKMAHTISFQTRTPRIAGFGVATLIGMVGVCLLLYGAFLMFIDVHRKRMNKQQTPLLSDQDNDQLLDREDSTNNNSIVTD